MITVHHLNESRSQRILWLLEELEVPYEIKFYWRDPHTKMAPAELQQIHPLGKSPIITDDGRAIAESGAIIDYIIRHFADGRLQPAPGVRTMTITSIGCTMLKDRPRFPSSSTRSRKASGKWRRRCSAGSITSST